MGRDSWPAVSESDKSDKQKRTRRGRPSSGGSAPGAGASSCCWGRTIDINIHIAIIISIYIIIIIIIIIIISSSSSFFIIIIIILIILIIIIIMRRSWGSTWRFRIAAWPRRRGSFPARML